MLVRPKMDLLQPTQFLLRFPSKIAIFGGGRKLYGYWYESNLYHGVLDRCIADVLVAMVISIGRTPNALVTSPINAATVTSKNSSSSFFFPQCLDHSYRDNFNGRPIINQHSRNSPFAHIVLNLQWFHILGYC